MNSRIALISILSTTSFSAMAESPDRDMSCPSLQNAVIAQTNTTSTSDRRVQPYAPPYASARPRLWRGLDVIFFGDYLRWKAQEEGLAYGFQSINPTALGLNALNDPFLGASGRVSRVHAGWEQGYRIGATYQFPGKYHCSHDQWDLTSAWTRFTSLSHDSIPFVDGKVVFIYWAEPNDAPLATSAKAKWKLWFDVLDINLSRAFYLGKHFSVKPYAGFKAAWIRQDLTLRYLDIHFNNGTTPSLISKNRNHFQGYGIEMGMDGKWRLWGGFHLFGKFESALLVGRFKLSTYEKEPGTQVTIPRTKLKGLNKEISPMLAMQGGMGWETQFRGNRFYFNIHAAYEEQLWFNQNQLSRFVTDFNEGMTFSQMGDLSLSGWTIGAMLGF